jgi:polysaccharide pyruvyl transferase WcaK-like protein
MLATEVHERISPRPQPPVATTRAGRGLSIGILAHVGVRNLGDEIMYAATVSYYRRHLPEARLVGFSSKPDDTRTRYGIGEVHPIRPHKTAGPVSKAGGRLGAYVRTLRATIPAAIREARFAVASVRRLRGLDVVIVPGSSQFIDAYGGPAGFPLALLRWTLFARAVRVPICFLSLGAEELGHPLSRWMVRRTISLANFITLRDEVSRDRLAAQGVRREIAIAPDLSLGYAVSLPERGEKTGSGTVGINPIPYYHKVFWRAVDENRYQRYLESMIGLAAEVLRRGQRVVIYGTTQWADCVPTRDMVDGLSRIFGPDVLERVTTPAIHTLEDLVRVLTAVDWVVASRYHGVATALLMRKPVVGIAYEQKTADLMANLGLGEYSIPIDKLDGSSLAALLNGLQRNDYAIRQQLDARVREGRAAVDAQYKHVMETYTSARRDLTWA